MVIKVIPIMRGEGVGDPTLNLANPVPTPYPQTAISSRGGHMMQLMQFLEAACHPLPPGDAVRQRLLVTIITRAIYSLDGFANAKANTMKQTDPSGLNVEIYVLRFASPPGDNLASGDSTLVHATLAL